MKDPHDIILRPVLTEKGYDGIADKQYVFEVARFTPTRSRSRRRLRRYSRTSRWSASTRCAPWAGSRRQGKTSGRTPEVKKAYVTLTKDSKPIEFFEGMV